MARPRSLSRTEAVLSGVFLAAVLGGSVVTFDASLPWVYHEVYLWSMASVVGSLYWLLRVVTTRRTFGNRLAVRLRPDRLPDADDGWVGRVPRRRWPPGCGWRAAACTRIDVTWPSR